MTTEEKKFLDEPIELVDITFDNALAARMKITKKQALITDIMIREDTSDLECKQLNDQFHKLEGMYDAYYEICEIINRNNW